MKILHIIPSLETGGAQQLVADLVPLFNSFPNCETTIIVFKTTSSDIEKNLLAKGIKIIPLHTSLRSPLAILRLRKYIKEADVIHAHLFPANYYAVLANLGFKKPLFFTEHNSHNRRREIKLLRPLEKFFYSQYNKIICISDATLTELKDWIGENISKGRLEIVSNGIDIDRFRNSTPHNVEELFGKDGIPILMISRFSRAKDQATVIRALKFVSDPQIFVVFAGEGPTLESIKKIADDEGLKDRVVFLGNRNDIPDLIKSSAIGVQSSIWEGFGLTVVEMMAGGLPVIASDVEGLNKVVEGAGLLFKTEDPSDLANNIEYLLKDDNAEYFIEAGAKRAKEYSIQKTAENYLKIYKAFQ